MKMTNGNQTTSEAGGFVFIPGARSSWSRCLETLNRPFDGFRGRLVDVPNGDDADRLKVFSLQKTTQSIFCLRFIS